MENHKTLEIIKRTVLFYLPDSEVRLFGSRAVEKFNSDSDFDILIITNQQIDVSDKFPLKTKIRKRLLQHGIRTDILIQSKEDVIAKKKTAGSYYSKYY